MFIKKISSTNAAVYKYSSPDKGDLFCLLSVDSFSSGNAERLMKLVWDGIVDEYMYAETGPLESLKIAIKAGEKKLRSLLQNDDAFEESGVGLNITVFVVRGSNLYVGNMGDNGVDLWRQDRFIDISEILNSHNVVAGSALMEDEDVLIVSTNTLREIILSQEYSYNNILDIEQNIVEGGMLLYSKQEQIAQIEDLIEDNIVSEEVYIEETVLNEDELENSINSEMDAFQSYENASTEEVFDDNLIADNQYEVSDSVEEKNSVGDFGSEEDEISNENEVEEMVNRTMPMPRIYHVPVSTDRDDSEEVERSPFAQRVRSVLIFIKQKSPAVVAFLTKAGGIISNIFTKVTSFLGRILGGSLKKIRDFFDEKYGRKPWYRNLTAKLTQTEIPLITRKPSASGMRIDGYKLAESRNKKIGIAILAVLLVVVIYFGVKYTQKIKQENEIHDTVLTGIRNATTYLDSADRDAQTNASGAGTSLVKAKDEINKANKIALKEEDKTKLNALLVRLQKSEDTVYKRVGVSEGDGSIEVYMDTKLSLGDKSAPSDITIYKNDTGNEFLLISDSGEKGVFRVSIYDKQVIKVPDASGKITSPKFVEVGVSGIFVFDNANGIVKSSFDSGNLTDFASLTGLSSQTLGTDNVAGMAVFTDNDNVYIIDKKQGGILKSIQTETGSYSLAIKYVDDKSLAQGTDLFADSSIYYTFLGGQGIKKSLGGQIVTMTVANVLPQGGSYVAGYAGDTVEKKIFIFDKDNKRILVFERPDEDKNLHPNELVLTKQIVYRGDKSDVFSNVKDIVADSTDKVLYVLDGLRVWKIKL